MLTIDEIRDHLAADNPTAPVGRIELYASQFHTYAEADANIRANGTVCAHPRTGSPIANPYVPIRAATYNLLQRTRLVTTKLWLAHMKSTNHVRQASAHATEARAKRKAKKP